MMRLINTIDIEKTSIFLSRDAVKQILLVVLGIVKVGASYKTVLIYELWHNGICLFAALILIYL